MVKFNHFISSCLAIVSLISSVECKNPFFTPCKASDPNLNQCATKIAKQFTSTFLSGDPEKNLEAFEKYDIDDIRSRNLGLIDFSFINNVVYITSIDLQHIKLDPKQRLLEISLVSTGNMISDYIVNGTLVILPVNGNGKSNITIVETKFLYKVHYDIVKGKDGKDHWKIVKQQATYTPKRVTFAFGNLFNGNKQLADVVHRFVNENWKEVIEELGEPIMTRITRRNVKQFGKFFALVPAEDLLEP